MRRILVAVAAAAFAAPVKGQDIPWDLIDRGPHEPPNLGTLDLSGFSGPIELGGAIKAPLDCNQADTYIGAHFLSVPFDPNACVAACIAQSFYDRAHPPADHSAPRTCQFVNAFLLHKNGALQGFLCSAYTQYWPASYATNYGQWRGFDEYTISNSYASWNRTSSGTC